MCVNLLGFSVELEGGPLAMLRACGTMGYPPLQRALTAYLGTSRGVICAAEQVAIVSGTQEAIDLVIRLCIDAGDRVCLRRGVKELATALAMLSRR